MKNKIKKNSTQQKIFKSQDTIKIDKEKIDKYAKGSYDFSTRKIKHKNLKRTLEETKEKIKDSAINTAVTEILLPSNAGFIETENEDEKVYKTKQKDILDNVDLNTAKNAFDFQLTKFGPYHVNYSRNGRYLLMAGKKGHIANYDCIRMKVGGELQLNEEVHDAQYLHNESMYAVAQKKYVYIYDYKGIEIHRMKKHENPYKLEYLPYHFLLASVGHSGWVKWHDVSTGEYVAGFSSGHGPCRVMKQNPQNAVLHLGHSNGVVSLWSPASSKSLVSLLCHAAPITDVAIDRDGRYMTTAALDGKLKIWDLRKFSNLNTFSLDQPANSLDISERGLIGIGMGRRMKVLRDAFIRTKDIVYLEHEIRTPNAQLSSGGGVVARRQSLLSNVLISSVRFRPLEDAFTAGHSHGITSIIVPGAGEPNFDSFENNPFASNKQRREAEVQNLLNKLSYDMIGLESSFVGTVEKDRKTLLEDQKSLFYEANKKEIDQRMKEKDRKRGRNKISAKLKRKQKNVIDAQMLKLKERQQEEQGARAKGRNGNGDIEGGQGSHYGALKRFAKK